MTAPSTTNHQLIELQRLSKEDGKLLLDLAKLGKLYEIKDWIAAGKSTQMPLGSRKTPLGIAVDSGFHSLVRLLASHEADEPC